jgi:hypothetical protein
MYKSVVDAPLNSFENRGVRYFPERQKYRFADFQFNVIDLGVLTSEILHLYRRADCCVLCVPAKPYVIKSLVDVLKMLGTQDLSIIYQSVPEAQKEDYLRIVEAPGRKIYFSGYSPDLFDGQANATIWNQIVSEYLISSETVPRKKILGLL